MKKEFISYTDFIKLASSIQIDPLEYDGIICPLRGGFYLSNYLSHKYSLPMFYVDLHSYADDKKRKKIYLDSFQNVDDGRYLLVDDIYDSGNTIKFIKNVLYHHAELDVCTLVSKQSIKNLICTKYVETDVWVEFFWEIV